MIALKILAIIWVAPTVYGVVHIFVPYFLDLVEDARWQRLHPDMPSWRRVQS